MQLILLIIIVPVVIIVSIYNQLVRLKNKVKNAWSQIDIQLKRRYNLIPNLVNTVKGYAAHEKETLKSVIKARQQAINSMGIRNQANAENFLSVTLKSLFAVVENYPNLKANRNFRELYEEITTTENKIAYARQSYNDSVLNLNNKIEMFPSNIAAEMFNFKQEEMFEISGNEERKAPEIKI